MNDTPLCVMWTHLGLATAAGCARKGPKRSLHRSVAERPRDGAWDVRVPAAVLAVWPGGEVGAHPHALIHGSGSYPGAVLKSIWF